MIRQSSTPASRVYGINHIHLLIPGVHYLQTAWGMSTSIISSQKCVLWKPPTLVAADTALCVISDLWQGWILYSICTHCLVLEYMPLSRPPLNSAPAHYRLLVMISGYTSCFVDHATLDQWCWESYNRVSQEASQDTSHATFRSTNVPWVCIECTLVNCRIVFPAVFSDQRKRQAYVFSRSKRIAIGRGYSRQSPNR